MCPALPVNAVYFTGYEFLKRNWTSFLNPPRAAPHAAGDITTFAGDGTPVPVLHDAIEPAAVALPSYAYPICGAISGCLAAAATAPLDLVKTRLQTQGKTGQYKGAIDCAIKIVKHEGAGSMMRGLGGQPDYANHTNCPQLACDLGCMLTHRDLLALVCLLCLVVARCLWLSPNIALTMTTYELIKKYFHVE